MTNLIFKYSGYISVPYSENQIIPLEGMVVIGINENIAFKDDKQMEQAIKKLILRVLFKGSERHTIEEIEEIPRLVLN